MEYLFIAICAFLASWVTFYSGFGLGTILMPIIALFFPLPIAIGLTAVVHLFQNLLKTAFLWKWIDWQVAWRFGGAAGLAAIFGAWMLTWLAGVAPLYKYTVFGMHKEISVLSIVIGLLLIFFATAELLPTKGVRLKNLFLGGLISGFFGGLSGNQGAFRSLFLVNSGMTKESFLGTNAAIASVVDGIRLGIYWLSFNRLFTGANMPLMLIGMTSALCGVSLGMLILSRITFNFIQKSIVVLLYLFGVLLVVGII